MDHLITKSQYQNSQLIETLQQKFHFNSFRPGQFEAIITLMQQNRLLCIQPTGHGKSLLYQLPAVLLEGMTIVISPLLALVRDQVQQLNNRFNIQAASINSDQSDEENNLAQIHAKQNKIKILFIAPEKLDHLDYVEFLLNLPVSLVVVDEAHCISTWGHDFRPSYRQIIHFIQTLEKKNAQLKVLALTATANQKTEQDIKKQLSYMQQNISIQRHNMNRANIQLSVIMVSGIAEKLNYITQLIQQLTGHGLIYCATRENTELTANYLQKMGINAIAYHAGLDPEVKRQLQQNFINNHYKVITATNALGMGIDKQDLRFIIHFDMPGSITAYYQEVGRCGRDGKSAQGILLFDEADKKIQEYFIDSAQPSNNDFKLVLNCVAQSASSLGLTDIKRLTGLHPTRVTIVIAELIEQGFLAKRSENRKQIYYLTQHKKQLDLSRYENQLLARINELNEMIHYGKQSADCLMKILRMSLGDVEAEQCGHCSICQKSINTLVKNDSEISTINNWLSSRISPINLSTKNQIEEGVAVLNAQLRSPIFIEFMKKRTHENISIYSDLMAIINQQLTTLKEKYPINAVICVPSRTWLNKNVFAQYISHYLGAKLFIEYLYWRTVPQSRQGELLNNDQRRHNVDQHMQHNKQNTIPPGVILLLDDYIGSGATLQEATRVLCKDAKLNNTIVPFTIAAVKWRLGKSGMI